MQGDVLELLPAEGSLEDGADGGVFIGMSCSEQCAAHHIISYIILAARTPQTAIFLCRPAGMDTVKGCFSAATGDVQLSELKARLATAGIGAEFSSGQLVCGNRVVVKRKGPEEDELTLEGPLCDDFFMVREALYAQYHVC